MDAYRESIHSQNRASHHDRQRSDGESAAPTLADMAQWKDESARFLHDVREQLNEILAELDRTLTGDFSTTNETSAPAADAYGGPGDNISETESDDRISALKARLASKLHSFEEAGDRTNQETSSWEAGR